VAARVADGALGEAPATLVRLEGFGPSVAARAEHLGGALARVGPVEQVHGAASAAIWRDVRDVRPFCDSTEKPVWRISCTPSEGHALVMSLRRHAAADAFYDWQGGLVWLKLEDAPEAELVRAALQHHGGGHAFLVRASESVRAATEVFQPQPAPLAALARRLRDQFDPAGVLNPGRMG